MSRLAADFAPSPALAEAAERHAAAERDARRSTVDRERVERNADALARGDDSVPSEALICAREVEVLAHAGVPVESVARLLDAAAKCGATERETLVEHARRAQRPALGGEPPRRRTAPPPDLDVEDLLADLRVARLRIGVAARRGLSCMDLPTLVFLAAVSCALAAKVRGLTHNNDGSEWRVWSHLYIGVEVPSGANKSMIADLVLRDVLDGEAGVWTKIEGEQEDAVAADEEEREGLLAEQKKLRRSDPGCSRLVAVAKRLALPRIERPVVAEFGSPSPEQFVRLCHRSGFRAVVPDEAKDFLLRFVGSGATEERVGPLLNGFDGGKFSFPSISGEQRGDHPRFPRLHLTILLALQEGVLSPQVQAEALRLKSITDRGFFPRCLIARPRALTRAERHALEDEAVTGGDAGGAAYKRILRSIADYRVGDHPLAPSEPLLIPFTDDATRARRAYQVRCGDDVAADGPDVGKPGARSIARLHDHAARIAICLAAWRCAEQADAEGRALDLAAARVELTDVERAIRVCEGYFRPHVLAVAGRAILDEAGDDAEALREALVRETERARTATVRQRDAQRALGRGWNAGRVKRAADELEARGGLLVERAARGGATFTLAP